MENSKKLSELISQIQSIHKFDVRLRNQVGFEDYINISVPNCYRSLLSLVEKFKAKGLTTANLVELKKCLAPKINVLRNELTLINRDHAKLYAPDLCEINDELSAASFDLQVVIDRIESIQKSSKIENVLDLTDILYQVDKSISKVSSIIEDEDRSSFGRAITEEDFRLINLICAMHHSLDQILISDVGMQEYLSKDFGYFDDLSNFKDDQAKTFDIQESLENAAEDDCQLLEIIVRLSNNPTLQSGVLNFLNKI